MKSGRRAVRYSEKSTAAATARDGDVQPCSLGRVRQDLVAEAIHQVSGGFVLQGGRWEGRHKAAVGVSGSFGTAGVTKAVPGSPAKAWVTVSRVAGSVPSGISVLSSSGPLKPGPKPAASRSYALRVVVSSG